MPFDGYVAQSGVWVPFRGSPIVVPPTSEAHQIIGMTVRTGGVSYSSPTNQVTEEQRLAGIFGWPNGGPPAQRFFYTTQTAPGNGWIGRLCNENRIPWASIKPGTGGVAQDRQGGSDARFTGWGQYMASLWPKPIWFSYDHETDRSTHSGATNVTSPGWVQYMADFRAAHDRMVSVMKTADPSHGLEHVTFAGIVTGFACKQGSNRDPGQIWTPSMDAFAADGYNQWIDNQGNPKDAKAPFYQATGNNTGTGKREHYEFILNPLTWYQKYHPTWTVPTHITANLHRFPTRTAHGETGTCMDMAPNGSNTQWVPREDPEDDNNYISTWIRQMGADIREHMPRLEIVSWWHDSDGGIGYTDGTSPIYFAGPGALRWGAEFGAPKRAFREICQMPEHQGPLTPWTTTGLA